MAKSASEAVSLPESALHPPRAIAPPLKPTSTAGSSDSLHAQTHPVLTVAAWHSLAWLYVANLIGVWLAVLLLYPAAGRWLGEWSYGRWTPVHLNFQLYGWMALPLVAWAIGIYRADREPYGLWSRTALILWSLALTIGAVAWLNGRSSGKLFLDWTGFVRVFFPLTILFLWGVLAAACRHHWSSFDNRTLLARAARLIGLVLLLLVPFAIYFASDPAIYPAVNPDTGGPTGASQLESTLVIVLILFLLPYGLVERKTTGRRWIQSAWILFAIEALLCLGLGRQDVSHHRPIQFISLGSLLVWVPLIPAYYSTFQWPANTRLWRMAAMGWWALLVPAGWCLFLPGILDRLKFTDGLVGHSIMAMAGFVTSLLVLILAVLLEEDAVIFNGRPAFIAWHGATFVYVALFLVAGWKEGVDPGFTMIPGSARDILYIVRLLLGLAMTAASAQWFWLLTRRMRSRSSLPLESLFHWSASEPMEHDRR